MSNTYNIIPVKGHYEAYDDGGKFIVSGDTYEECYNDLHDIIIAEARAVENIREAVAV